MSLLFNPIKNRWFNTYNAKSEIGKIFKGKYSDFDDPTYLTFKIEFGDWGSSILDRNALKLGITTFNALKSDYDALPIGLLNCPAPGDPDEQMWQTSANIDSSVFNNANIYSAFKYLRSRNEDTRAEYLYYFVNGLLEIQKETPYIFKKISGIDQLDQFDPKAGQRLKTPAKITLDCYEGLNLKIRTLMELYRKAAWDDVYQRWIIPENLREFKMIIYIFERRTFQEDALNGDIPVKAYECCPCEFEIKPQYKGDYDGAYQSGGEESTQISITVKNVKTFFKNGLLNNTLDTIYLNKGVDNNSNLDKKLDTLMIYDLVETVERYSNIYANSEDNIGSLRNLTINGARALFLNKNILLENEDLSPNVQKTGWRFTLVNGLKFDKSKSFFGNLGANIMNVITGTRRWILATDTNNNLVTNNIWNNIMNYLLPPDDRYIPVSVAADIRNSNIYNLYADERFIGTQNMLHNHPQVRQTGNENIISIEGEREPDNLPITNIEGEREPADQQYLELGEPREYSNDLILEMNEPRTPDELPISGLGNPRIPDSIPFTELSSYRQIAELQFAEMNDPREITLEDFYNLDKTRESEQLPFTKMGDPREIINQKYIEMNPERKPDNIPFGKMNNPREIAELQYIKLNSPRKHIEGIENLYMIARHIPEFKDFKMDDYRKLSPEEIRNLSDLVARLVPTFSADKSLLEARVREAKTIIDKGFTDADNNQKKIENDSIDALKKNTVLTSLENSDTSDSLAKQRQAIKDFTADFAQNSDKIKHDMVDSILNLKDKLRDLTLDNIRKLPDIDIVKLEPSEKDNKQEVLLSIEDIRQIENNIKLIGLEEKTLRELSFQTIVNLQQELENNITVTNNMQGLTNLVERDVQNSIKQEKPKERKKLGQKMMNLDGPVRKVDKETIIY